MNLGLGGKVALVTGGARDVGREISLTLAREGAAVAVNYMHSKADADSLVAEIVGLGGRAVACQADVADYDAVSRMVERVAADLGRLDVVVNNAGYVESRLFLETRPDEWRRQIDVCLYGVYNTC
ncbi:MAG: SDR family NAD(P)-dependent oxidoreductase, partial [Candidatus Rokuibacteriota bacterium]